MKKHIYICDYMRAVSAIFVVLFHYTSRYEELFGHRSPYPLSFSWGSMGVAVFFLLSAFLTAVRMDERMTPGKWCFSRFVRLYPMYWAAMILTAVVTGIFLPERAVSGKAFVFNCTMLQDFVGIASVDGAYWTLRYELTFYLFVFALLLIAKAKHLKVGMWCWMGVAMLLDLAGAPGRVKDLLLCSYISPFVLGVTLGSPSQKHVVWDAAVMVIALLYFGCKNGVGYALYLAAAAALLLATRIPSVRAWKLPSCLHVPLTFMAGISYPLYLLHQNIGYAVIRGLENAGCVREIFLLFPITVVTAAAFGLNEANKRILKAISRR